MFTGNARSGDSPQIIIAGIGDNGGHLSVAVIVARRDIEIVAELLILQLAVPGILARPLRRVGNFLKIGALVGYKVLHPIADLRREIFIIHIAKTDKDSVIVSACAERVVGQTDSESDIIDRGNAVCTAWRLDNILSECQLVIYLGMILCSFVFRIAVAVNDRLIPWGKGKRLPLFCAVWIACIFFPSGRGICVGCEQCAVCTRGGCARIGITHQRCNGTHHHTKGDQNA